MNAMLNVKKILHHLWCGYSFSYIYQGVDLMDLAWGSNEAKKFVTNIGLITSNGPHGQNVMAAEWTHHISYSPGLIAINIHSYDATYDNIMKNKEFGVNLASIDQNIMSSVSGSSSGKKVDKIKILQDLGIEFYKAKKIDTLMVKGAALNAECKVIKIIELGDHTMFVGEVVEVFASDKEPLVFSKGSYWHLGEQIKKPPQEIIDKINRLVEKHKK